MVINQHAAPGAPLRSVGLLADKASRLVQMVAAPSLVQLVMRVALAVPFWKSGILKWDGFLKLSDVAVTLFTDEFMIHLPGGPYHYPMPTVMAFLSGCPSHPSSAAGQATVAGAWVTIPNPVGSPPS